MIISYFAESQDTVKANCQKEHDYNYYSTTN